MPGHWRPVKASSENVWIGGYHHNGIWVTGMWRPRSKVGFHWRRGRWGPKGWVVGSWVGGKRPILKRRHRVIRYDRMSKRRVQKRRTWRRGEAQRRTGKGQQRRGKAMTRTGKATGNKRLERKGKKTTRRGKKNVRKGKSKKRRSRR